MSPNASSKRSKQSEFSRLGPLPKLFATLWIVACLLITWLIYRLAIGSFWGFNVQTDRLPDGTTTQTWSMGAGAVVGYAVMLIGPLIVGYLLYALGFRMIIARAENFSKDLRDLEQATAIASRNREDTAAADGTEGTGIRATDPGPLPTSTIDPDVSLMKRSDDYSTALLRVLVHVSLADGKLLNIEVRRMVEIFNEIAGTSLTKARFEAEVAAVRERGDVGSLGEELVQLTPRLSERGREHIVQAAARVMVSDQDIDQEEWELLWNLAGMLELSEARFKELVQAEIADPDA